MCFECFGDFNAGCYDRLKAENERLRGGLKHMRKECFDDSEWAAIIDKALKGGE